MLFGYVEYIFYSVNGSALYYTKVVQIWYKKEAWSAKPLSLRVSKTTKSSIPVAGISVCGCKLRVYLSLQLFFIIFKSVQ